MKPCHANSPCRLKGDGDAISDVVGSVILVALTVVMAAALGGIVLAFRGPTDVPQANVSITVSPGQGGWSSGDESIRLTHNGGEPLGQSQIAVTYRVNNGAATTVTGSSLAFSGGNLNIGETWSRTLTLASTDVVNITVVASGRQVLSSASLIPGVATASTNCPFDVFAPTATWTEVPDVGLSTATGTNVTATLADDCAGVNTATVPSLFYRISPAQSSYTSIVMTRLSGTQWYAIIPAPAASPLFWANYGGQTLQWYLSPATDLKGNTGTTAVQSDLIQLVGTNTYVTGHTEIAPTSLTNPGNLAANDSLLATINEGPTAANLSKAASAQISAGTGWASGSNAFAHESGTVLYATNGNAGPGALRLGFADPTNMGIILAVRLKIVQDISVAAVDDTWSAHACLNGGACGAAAIPAQLGTTLDTTLTFNLTADRPGGGGWSWTDLNNFEASIQPNKVGTKDGTWRLDYAYLDILYRTYGGTEQLDWTGVPAGTTGLHFIDLGYSGAGAETWNVNVWNWVTSTYTTRATLTSTGTAQAYYLLGLNEYQVAGGNVRIQIVDAVPADTTGPNSVSLDYARVVTP